MRRPSRRAAVVALLTCTLLAGLLAAEPLRRSVPGVENDAGGAETVRGQSGRDTPPDAKLFGVVLDTDGRSVAGAMIRLESESIYRASRSTSQTTNASGAFAFVQVTTGPYRLVLRHPGFAFHVTNRIDINAGASQEANVVLRRRVAVAGRLVNDDGKTIRGSISVHEIAGAHVPPSLVAAATVESLEDGAFQLDALGAGRHVLTLSAVGHVPAEVAVTVPHGVKEFGLGNLRLVRGHESRGLVLDQSSKPIAGAAVRILHAGPVEGESASVSRADGTYTVNGLPDGLHRMMIAAPGFGATFTELRVPDGVEHVVFLRATGSLRGRVVDINGAPLDDYRITLQPAVYPGRPFSRAYESSGGSFAFDGLDAGVYRVAVTTDQGATSDEVVIQSGEDADLGEIRVHPSSPTRSKVTRVSGDAAPAPSTH